jgi:hypothetical protein
MALLFLTVNDASPAMATRAAELAFIARALRLAEIAMRGPGGTVTSGDIMGDGQILLGTWSYAPQASS